jgi:hypothetical protein
VTVTCSSTTGNAAQGVRFRVVSDGRMSLSSGVIDNSSYTVTSSALLTTACGAPSACSVSPTVAEGNAALSWSGASAGTNNAITGFEIQYSDSANNADWGSWTALTTVSSSSASGSLSVAPPAARGSYRRFRIRTQGSAGSSYYSGWTVSSNSVRKNTPPEKASVLTASPSVYSEGPITLTWSGASGGTSLIKGYMLASKTSTDGSTWTSWNVLETFNLSASSGTRTAAASTTPGTYTKYGLWTIDTLDVYSAEQVSNTILCVAAACDEPAIAAPKTGASTYNPNPRVLMTTGTQPNEQVVQVKIGAGSWQDGVNNPSLFSPSGAVGGSAAVMFKAESQTAGVKTLTVRCVNPDFEAPSAEVSRSLTVLASPFEEIAANETKVKAIHITALRTAVNTVREYYGLAPVSWSEEITAGKTEVKNWPLHILEIRTAVEPVIAVINQYSTDSGFAVPEPDWEELGTGRPRAAVMTQLSELLLSL